MLPERRKSADEIAKLRESLGVPGAAGPAAAEPPAPAETAADAPAAPPVRDETEPAAPAPSGPLPPARQVRSLRRSERQEPAPRPAPVPSRGSGVIPARRHSEREIMEMRRVQAAPPDQSIAYIRNLAVPLPLVLLGYALPLGGALLGWLARWMPTVTEPDFPAMWMADLSRKPWLGPAGLAALVALCAAGLLLAGWFAWKKPRSRHHAGFITIIAVFTVVFALIIQSAPAHGP